MSYTVKFMFNGKNFVCRLYGLSLAVLAQFALKLCRSRKSRKKSLKPPILGDSRSLDDQVAAK